jgi:glycosyltransferase involved in cell wall biosynthesis
MKILYFSPASYGGIADYAHEQANALVDAGAEVILLTTPRYPTGRGEKYDILPILRELKPDTPVNNKVLKITLYTIITLTNIQTLVRVIRQQQIRYVLFGSYSEYIAPLWTGSLRRLARQGVVFGAVVHDPVRNFVLGPLWWHRWSIASGYSFLREAFVHETVELDTVRPTLQLRTTVIPHGAYRFSAPTRSRQDMRAQLDLPTDAIVMLAFGHIRDNKNLDLVIQAMVHVPDVYLVVAGNEMSSSSPLVPRYKVLANELGVGDRIRWQVRFIADCEVGNFFQAVDVVVLAYSRRFRSASGVFNIAAKYHTPCIASGGQGSFASVIKRYRLGVWVEPDSLISLVAGLKLWLENPPTSEWIAYRNENSWAKNAELTLKALKS